MIWAAKTVVQGGDIGGGQPVKPLLFVADVADADSPDRGVRPNGVVKLSLRLPSLGDDDIEWLKFATAKVATGLHPGVECSAIARLLFISFQK